MPSKCTVCGAKGLQVKYVMDECKLCHKGQTVASDRFGLNLSLVDCSSCDGSGMKGLPRLVIVTCGACKGKGYNQDWWEIKPWWEIES
jgi:DnaJ-class molecular chaperone